MINVIAAVARNRAIGNGNKLIYWLPNDLKRFKALTTGHTIIMGRNTFDSLPKGALPNRRNVVLSHSVKELPGCDVYASLDEALAHCAPDEDVYIIGGGMLYRSMLPYYHKVYVTMVNEDVDDATVFFPNLDELKDVFAITDLSDMIKTESGKEIEFITYTRKVAN